MPPRVATARLQPRRPPASANLPNKAVPCLLASNPSQKLESRSSLKGNPLSDSVSSDSALASPTRRDREVREPPPRDDVRKPRVPLLDRWHNRRMDVLDRQACYRAIETRDARFDGRLFVGVTSTGIYCRPICPARTPKFANCRIFPSAAAAQEVGFRPCLRCRPETAPDLAFWRGSSNTVSRALALMADGALA